LTRVKTTDEDEKIGVDIVRRALEEPIRMIAQNAGAEASIVVGKVKESKDKNFGYNAQTDVFEDLVAAGVIDPTKVTRTGLQNAAPGYYVSVLRSRAFDVRLIRLPLLLALLPAAAAAQTAHRLRLEGDWQAKAGEEIRHIMVRTDSSAQFGDQVARWRVVA